MEEDDEESVIPILRRADFDAYVAQGIISGGMIPKIDNAFQAIRSGVKKVIITRADNMQGGTQIIE